MINPEIVDNHGPEYYIQKYTEVFKEHGQNDVAHTIMGFMTDLYKDIYISLLPGLNIDPEQYSVEEIRDVLDRVDSKYCEVIEYFIGADMLPDIPHQKGAFKMSFLSANDPIAKRFGLKTPEEIEEQRRLDMTPFEDLTPEQRKDVINRQIAASSGQGGPGVDGKPIPKGKKAMEK